MDSEKLSQIRAAEKESHTEIYNEKELFSPGSWLAKPVKTVLDLLPLFENPAEFRALDLGCGVGRNSIPVAQRFGDIPCRVDCVDILDVAIEKLAENARRFGVGHAIHGVVSPIEDYPIEPGRYDLILAVSALEHVASEGAFVAKLEQIRDGLRPGGVACLIINSGVREQDKATGRGLAPQFEVNLPTRELRRILEQTFGGWEIIKYTVNHQNYEIPRAGGTAQLETDVVTCAARKK